MVGAIPFVAPFGVWWALGATAVLGTSTSFLQSAAYSFASVFPQQYAGAFYTAQAYAGLTTALLRIATKLLMPDDIQGSVIIYFTVAFVIQLLCAVGFEYLACLPVTKAFVNESVQARAGFGSLKEGEQVPGLCSSPVDDEATKLVKHRSDEDGGAGHAVVPRYRDELYDDGEGDGAGRADCWPTFLAAAVADETKDESVKAPPSRAVLRSRSAMFGWVCGRGFLDTFNILFVFVVTFVPLPNMIEKTVYQGALGSLGPASAGWWGTILVTLFNVGDCLGRFTAEKLGNPFGRWYTAITLLRTLTIAGFWAAQWAVLGPGSDYMSLAMMLTMSFTNGWCSAIAFGSAPSRVDPDYMPQLGSITATGLIYGIALGGFVSIPVGNLPP